MLVKRLVQIGLPVLIVLLWLLIVRPPIALDYGVYRLGASAVYGLNGLDANLYGPTLGYPGSPGLPFTYPPFAALIFLPIALLPKMVGFSILTMCTVLVAYWLANKLASSSRSSMAVLKFGKLKVSAIGLWGGLAILSSGPWRDTIDFGQINAILLFVCLWDLLKSVRVNSKWNRWSGFLVGVAAGIKLTPLVFGFYYLVRRDFASLGRMIAGFTTTVLVAWIVAPSLSQDYWFKVILDPGRIGNLGYADNTSIRGTLIHLGLPADLVTPWWIGLSLALAALVGLCIFQTRKSEPYISIASTALLMLLVSPVTWSHHWVWLPVIVWSSYVMLSTLEMPRVLRWTVAGMTVVMAIAFWISPKWVAFLSGSNADGQMSALSMVLVSIGSISAYLLCVLWASALLASRRSLHAYDVPSESPPTHTNVRAGGSSSPR